MWTLRTNEKMNAIVREKLGDIYFALGPLNRKANSYLLSRQSYGAAKKSYAKLRMADAEKRAQRGWQEADRRYQKLVK
jgi:hypothetical protein